MYWYHSHRHERAQRQVMGGLSGGLVIEGVLDPFRDLAGIRERVMLLKDIQVTAQGTVPEDIDPSATSIRMVNGQVNPTLTIRPGETQFLRIANIGSDLYYKIRLEGHFFYEIARDGNRHTQIVTTDELLIPPSSRSEVLIQGAARGTYAMRALAFDTGPAGDSYPETVLATLVSQGDGETPIVLPTTLPTVEDLRNLAVNRKRTITFTESADGNTFYIDSGAGSKQFDPNRVDSTIESGTVEEWTVLNATQELHVFHIHQTDFQVTEVDGVAQPFRGHQDTVNVSFQASDTAPPGQVKMLIDFRQPLIVGKFVYHCHILEHEDGGMMAVAEVLPSVRSAVNALAAGFMRVVDRMIERKPSGPQVAARIEEVLDAVQAGSYCKTTPPAVEPLDAGSGAAAKE
jgi:FtsP/CotA-like multicopper oxidase with cupredoxin domain